MKYSFVFLLFLLSVPTFGQKLKLYTIEIPNINTQNAQSYYYKLITMIKKVSGEDFEVVFLPPSRAIRKFNQDRESCFFPYSKQEESSPKTLIFSRPLVDLELFAITKKSSELVTRTNIYKKKRIALNSSFRNSFFFPSDFKVYYVETEDQLFFMLDHDRVDYILESVPDIYLSFGGKEEFFKKYKFDTNYKHQVLKDYFACHKGSKRIEKLIKTINNKL
ncbi:hypothetical protein [Bacteriovorax sp. Seq25_V]|uniref:hypothetical protein n=1 Tax=Bacteriovorax sp. Seq25_V TaxID=1201288 RepID=UPI0012FBF2CD|nr:hypothetical protein [Bacteriovorax sp. Seq25_V]